MKKKYIYIYTRTYGYNMDLNENLGTKRIDYIG